MGIREALTAFTIMALRSIMAAGAFIRTGVAFLMNGDAFRWVQKHATLRNIFSVSVLLFFIYSCGTYSDIEPFINFFPNVYKYCFTVKFAAFLTLIGIIGFCWWYTDPCGPRNTMAKIQVGWQILVDEMHVFHSLEDGEHVDRTPKKPKKSMNGIAKGLRPPTIAERPQPTPQQQPGVEQPKQRSSSGASGSGSGSGQGKKGNGSGSRGKGKGRGKKKK